MARLGWFRDADGPLRKTMGMVLLDGTYAGEQMPAFTDADGRSNSAIGAFEIPFSGGPLPQNRNAEGNVVDSLGVVVLDIAYSDNARLPYYRGAAGGLHSAMGVVLIDDSYDGSPMPRFRDADGHLRGAMGIASLDLTTGEPIGDGASGAGPAVGDGLLLEDGISYLLLETGDFLLLE